MVSLILILPDHFKALVNVLLLLYLFCILGRPYPALLSCRVPDYHRRSHGSYCELIAEGSIRAHDKVKLITQPELVKLHVTYQLSDISHHHRIPEADIGAITISEVNHGPHYILSPDIHTSKIHILCLDFQILFPTYAHFLPHNNFAQNFTAHFSGTKSTLRIQVDVGLPLAHRLLNFAAGLPPGVNNHAASLS